MAGVPGLHIQLLHAVEFLPLLVLEVELVLALHFTVGLLQNEIESLQPPLLRRGTVGEQGHNRSNSEAEESTSHNVPPCNEGTSRVICDHRQESARRSQLGCGLWDSHAGRRDWPGGIDRPFVYPDG